MREERSVRARSALFELYGDHLRTRGAAAPVAAIVRLLEPLDIAAPAARTAISRMVREGCRVYRSQQLPTWDGRWHIVSTGQVVHRSARQRLRSGMACVGYAALGESTWISPRASARLRPAAQRFVDQALPARPHPDAYAPAPRRGRQEVPAV
jgi:phenylacetic acid degradation operon negative regulatory protein